MGVGGAGAAFDLGLDEPKVLDLVARVEALRAVTALWGDHSVAFLPCAEGGRGNVEHSSDSPDAVQSFLILLTHGREVPSHLPQL